MSNQPDQSYYEIALTNRQVMSIFVVLLVCILAAFLSGVWLGRGADGAVEMASAQSITAGVAPGEAPLEELDFFARREDERKPSEASAAEAPKAPEAAPPAAEPKAETTPPPEPAARVAESEDPVPAVAKQPEVAQTEAETPAAGPVERPVPSTGAGSEIVGVPEFLVIQVFSSTEEAQARQVVNRLRKGGYPAVLSPVEVDGRLLHRVRIGPYTDRDEAQVVAESVRRAFKLDTWITH